MSRRICKLEERPLYARKVFAFMRQGKSASRACKIVGLNQSTLNLWLNEDPVLDKEYARARADLQEKLADDLIALSDTIIPPLPDGKVDTGRVNQLRLRVDTRKWVLSKLYPKRYGEKVELSGLGESENTKILHEIKRVIVDSKGTKENYTDEVNTTNE